MSVINLIRSGYNGRKFLRTEGRVNRTQFWTFYVYAILLSAVVGALGFGSLSLTTSSDESTLIQVGTWLFYFASIGISAFAFLTTLQVIALAVRRLHDTNRSGRWVLLPLSGIVLVTTTATLLFTQAVESLNLTADTLEAGGVSGTIDLTTSGEMTLPTIAFSLALIYSLISGLYYLYLMLKAGDATANRFGDRP